MVTGSHPSLVSLAPYVHLGNYTTLENSAFLDQYNVKVIVNCGSTQRFLSFLDCASPVISSDVIVLNLDPNTSSNEAPYREFHSRFNKILQNYLAFFYNYNNDVSYFINSNYQNSRLALESPTMNGVPLKSLFNVNRLLKLIKNVNSSVSFLFVSEHFGFQHHSNSLLYSLAISYLMDSYNYNFEASYKSLQSLITSAASWPNDPYHFDSPELFNANHYEDVLLIDSLKKFHVENSSIKQAETGVMTKNFKLKRSLDSLETTHAAKAVKRVH